MNNSKLTLENCRIFTPSNTLPNGSVCISESGKIASISAGAAVADPTLKKIDIKGNSIIPGMIDIHVHGGMGVSFGVGDLFSDLEKYSRFATSHGVTGFLLSITGPNTAEITRIVKEYVQIFEQNHDWPGAIPLGIHLEGPFLNKEKHGAFNPAWIHNPSINEANAYLDAGNGWIKHISMAPELAGAEETAQLLASAGVVISLGHSNTNFETASAALKGRFSHVTHTFNAQSALHQREPGVVGAVLASDQCSAELIGDRLHVHPAAMRILYRCLGADRVVLITDAMQAAGMPDGNYELLEQVITVKNGRATLPDGTIGGSTETMEGCLRTIVKLAGVPMKDAVKMTSFNPAKVIKEDASIGSIEIGKEANLAILDDDFNVLMTIVKGKIVHSSESEV
jgi:N-acetylglucosamine-6-phosphate deacetylase